MKKNKFIYLIDKSNDDGRLDLIDTFLESKWEKEVIDFHNRQVLEKKIINADLAWLHKIHSAKIISNFLYDVTLLQDSVSSSLANGVKDILTLICLVGVMYYQDWQLATILIIAIP